MAKKKVVVSKAKKMCACDSNVKKPKCEKKKVAKVVSDECSRLESLLDDAKKLNEALVSNINKLKAELEEANQRAMKEAQARESEKLLYGKSNAELTVTLKNVLTMLATGRCV